MIKRIIFTNMVLLNIPITNAYLDPGTAGSVVGSIWPAIIIIISLAGTFLGKWLLKPIIKLFKKDDEKNKN